MDERRTNVKENRGFAMGLTETERGIRFCVASEGDSCSLVLFHGGEEERCETIPFSPEERMGDVWSLELTSGRFDGLEYCYEIDGVLKPDPYGRMFTGRDVWGELDHVNRLMKTPVVLPEFDWEGDRPLSIPYEESVLYRIHVRGFTKHASSRVRDKGTFKGVAEKIPYLKELGITALELMPVNEFEEVVMPGGPEGNPYGLDRPTGRLNYWGYGPGYHFAPKASYSSGGRRNPVHEYKALIKELHRAGIEVIQELYFEGEENPVMVLDAVRFWICEYHVDGIHLVGNAPAHLIGTDPYLSDRKLFFTSWEGIPGGRTRHLGEYNDGFMVDMRRVLKGDEDQMNNLIFRSKRNPPEHGVINYMANTNGFNLMDMVCYERKHNEANGEGNRDGNAYNFTWNCGVEGPTRKKKVTELRRKQIRNALLMLFLSQGSPLLLSGDEFGDTKGGNNNSYCQDNETSWINWSRLKANHDIFEFIRFLIAFRRRHPVFHMDSEPRVMDYLACGHPDVSYHGVRAWCPEFENFRRQLGIMFCGEYAKKQDGAADDYFFLAWNMHWEPHEFALPNLPKGKSWRVAVNTDAKEVNGIYDEGEEPPLENQKLFPVPPRTILVFIGK